MLLEGKAAQKAQERDILFLRYLYNDGTRPETRKRWQKCAGLCEVGPKQGAIEQFFDLGFPATVKTLRFSWPIYYSLASRAKFDIVRVDKTRIWDKLRAI